MHNPLCSVIIVTWNRRKELEAALDSVFAQSIAPRLEVIVVDNASQDDTVQWLTAEYPHTLRLLRYPNNMGSSHARNAGLLRASASTIAFLDSDAILMNTDAIERCLNHLQTHPEFRAVAGPIWFDRQKTRPFSLGGYITPDGHFDGQRSHSDHNDPHFISTCFSVWKKSLLQELGGFDPWYFWGIEDMDISLRARFRERRGIEAGATRFHIVEGADVLHEMSRAGRHYAYDDFLPKFHAFESQRLRLVLAYGGILEFFRVLVRTPSRLRRVEQLGWQQRLSWPLRFAAVVKYPLRRLMALPIDWIRVRRNHLRSVPIPEEIPQGRPTQHPPDNSQQP